MQKIQSTCQSRIIRRMKADALMQEAAVKLKSGFPCQMTDKENSSENNLMINIWARKHVVASSTTDSAHIPLKTSNNYSGVEGAILCQRAETVGQPL